MNRMLGLFKNNNESSSNNNLITKKDNKCSYNFGYLSKRKKNSEIPEECIECKKVLKCIQP